MRSYHQNLREQYSQILLEKISGNPILAQLSDKERSELFNELSKWFGTSPPEHNSVKKELKKILLKRIDYSQIKLEED